MGNHSEGAFEGVVKLLFVMGNKLPYVFDTGRSVMLYLNTTCP